MTLRKAFDGEVYYWYEDSKSRQAKSRVTAISVEAGRDVMGNEKAPERIGNVSEVDRVAARRLIHTLGSITGFENRVDLVLAALATVRAEEREAAWLPIETNPKDETWQIVAKFDDSGKMVWWQRAYWSSRRSLWKTEGGYCTPTHWTPLPAALVVEATENRKEEG